MIKKQEEPLALITLSADKILMAEFSYARETAGQAMEDRHRMVNYYLVIVGLTINAVVGVLRSGDNMIVFFNEFEQKGLIVFLLSALFLTGVLYLNKLIRLRWAWYGSAAVMNRIKDYYDAQLPGFHLKDRAFIWTTESLREMNLAKSNTVFFGSALAIIAINAMSISGAFYFVLHNVWISLAVLLFFLFLEIRFYQIKLTGK